MSDMNEHHQKYVSEHSSAFQNSKFYIEDYAVKEVYYNPDSNAGGQLVTNRYSCSSIVEAYENHNDSDSFWDHLGSTAQQYLTDIDASEFGMEAKEFVESPCDYSGNNEETMNAIYRWANGMEQTQSEPDMKMG